MHSTSFSRFAPLAAGALLLTGAGAAQAEITGNASVVSKYIFRGGAEDARTAFQGGLDYAHGSGFYAGTWFSTLNYNDPAANEIDAYAGYGGSAGELGYDVGLLYFYYTGDATEGSSVPEGTASVSYGPVSLSANVALDTVDWTAAGDTYVNLSFEQPLPQDFTFSIDAGYYFYAGDLEDEDGNTTVVMTEDGAFRDATVSLSHPLAATGASMHINYTVGGYDRTDANLDDNFWAGATWTF
ncbi:TorF family putative porin [Thiohalorhabdus sp.]|uniref:TorF family putative porin n=1 Tax=Thiohalorhabdus sp. TaxID=3094134 RepID=UPI002FC378F3